jgi:hypothetical protein
MRGDSDTALTCTTDDRSSCACRLTSLTGVSDGHPWQVRVVAGTHVRQLLSRERRGWRGHWHMVTVPSGRATGVWCRASCPNATRHAPASGQGAHGAGIPHESAVVCITRGL